MHQHFMLHKPYGYLSQFISNDRKEQYKKFLGSLYVFPEGTMAIGRLDEKSEGLILLTTDGKMSSYFTSNAVEKEYYVQVDGEINSEAIQQLEKGVEIGNKGQRFITRSCAVRKLEAAPEFPPRSQKIRDDRHGPTTWVSITLTEGKFKQVRKMTAAVGFPTLRLIRVRVGDFTVFHLKNGEVMELKRLL